jgi:hypothetical protein
MEKNSEDEYAEETFEQITEIRATESKEAESKFCFLCKQYKLEEDHYKYCKGAIKSDLEKKKEEIFKEEDTESESEDGLSSYTMSKDDTITDSQMHAYLENKVRM